MPLKLPLPDDEIIGTWTQSERCPVTAKRRLEQAVENCQRAKAAAEISVKALLKKTKHR